MQNSDFDWLEDVDPSLLKAPAIVINEDLLKERMYKIKNSLVTHTKNYKFPVKVCPHPSILSLMSAQGFGAGKSYSVYSARPHI